MDITCSINLATGDHFTMSSEEAANAILTALGGDAAKDICRLTIMAPSVVVGTPTPPPNPTPPA